MPFLDRYWWLRALWAMIAAGGAVAVIWFVANGLTGLDGIDTPITVVGNVGAFFVVCLCAGFSLYFLWSILTARDRVRRRRAAIAGDREAIPPARLPVRRESAPDVAAAPLILSWPPRVRFRSLVVRADVWSAFGGAVFVMAYGILFFSLPDGAPVPLPVFVLLAALVWICNTREPIGTLSKPRQLVATAEGIRRVPVLGRSRFIPWREMRLLEVAPTTLKTRRGQPAGERWYTLYAARAYMRWCESVVVLAAPTGEYADLLAVIAARTGLAPRTFDHDLATRPPWRSAHARGAHGVPVQTGDEAGPAMEVPPTFARERPVAYMLSVSRRRSSRSVLVSRLISLAFGLAFCVGAGVGTLWTLDQIIGPVVLPDVVQQLSWINWLIAFFLTIGVAAGPFIIVTTLVRMLRGAPPSPEGYVRADAEGLREHGPGRVTALAWGDIASVRRKRLGQSMLYFATSVDARERITWWTKGAPTLPRDPWEVNATLVSAEELAALVARRSGRAVEDFSAVPEGES